MSGIVPPGRASGAERAALLAIVLLFTAFPLLPGGAVAAVATATAALTALAWSRRWPAATAAGLFCSLCFAALATGVVSQVWLGAALVAQAALLRTVPWLRGAAGWTRRGAFGAGEALWAAACAGAAGVALLVWFLALRPDVGDILATYVPTADPWLLLAGGVGFSMVNAAVEEAAYRGVILTALEAAFGAGAAALVLQAIAFGTLHIHGFPRGWIGVGLASVYGLMMGAVRLRARGMLAPWAAHVATDLAIVAILVFLARR